MARRHRRGWTWLLVALVVAACGGCNTPASDDRSSASEAAGPETTSGHVTVQGHELSYNCIGEGSPTVVFMHGLGLASLDWAATARLLSDVHTCRFDRVNSGASEYVDGRRQVMDSVEEAHEFVAAAGLTPPYLLAGHSYGGLVSLLYAVAYPDEVSGILLADALLPIVAELDAQYLTPEEREALRVADNDNREHLDVPEGLIDAYAPSAAQRSIPRAVVQISVTPVMLYRRVTRPKSGLSMVNVWSSTIVYGALSTSCPVQSSELNVPPALKA